MDQPIKSRPKALVVLSGGQDSTTCLFWALAQGYEVHTLTFNYGQLHNIEVKAALRVAGMCIPEGLDPYNVEILSGLAGILQSTSPLVSNNELEQYADKDSLPGGIEKTFVPMRNQFFLTIAANRAVALGCNYIITGVCQEDFGGYPDCRREFIDALEYAINLGTYGGNTPVENDPPNIEILTPLMYLTKAQSIELALSLPNCYRALALSHTSYDGQYPPLGKDHATLLREKGFYEANVPDPLILRAVKEGLMPMPTGANYIKQVVDKYLPLLDGIEIKD